MSEVAKWLATCPACGEVAMSSPHPRIRGLMGRYCKSCGYGYVLDEKGVLQEDDSSLDLT